jgi:glycosyltransferase involved in cell wall biosynthesis
MKLLVLDQFSDPGGAQQVLLDLLPGMRERGWTGTVGLPGSGELFKQVRASGFEAERIDCGPYRPGRKTAADVARMAVDAPRLARYVRRFDSDLIYVNGPRLLPGVALARPRVPVVFHSHSYVFEGAGRKAAGWALGRTNALVLANCEFVANAWREYVRPQQLRVIYNGTPGPERTPAGKSKTGRDVGCIGRIAPEKGQREFVAAARRIHEQLPGCRFHIFGAALFGDRRAAAYEAGVRAAAVGLPVKFHGWLPDVYDALETLDLLLAPSMAHEATTRVILEAFAAAVPVIAFRSGGIPEVIDHGRTGMLANGVDEMAAFAVDLLTGDGEPRTKMTEVARTEWAGRFTVERFRREVLDALEEAAGASHRTAQPRLPR